jgi:hypothetical protein
LFDFWEKFLWFPIQNQLPNLLKGHKFFGPYFGRVKDVKIEVMFLRSWDGLDAKLPPWESAIFYSLIQVFPMEVYQEVRPLNRDKGRRKLTRILARNLESFVPNQTMNTQFRNPMEFDEKLLSRERVESIRVDTEALHHPEGPRDASVRHGPHDHMSGWL